MAVFKCKMCGGTLEVNNESVAVYQYCGTKQTLSKLDDDREANPYCAVRPAMWTDILGGNKNGKNSRNN